ncbi:MAG: hypothetical protein J6F30_06880 [Cellulosilyticum sp.]|nr:hypothetical protein [Cellulosilyticum sp.]
MARQKGKNMKRIFALLCGVLLVGCGSNNVSNNLEMNNTKQEIVSNEISQNNIEQNNSTSEVDKNNTSDTNESLEIEEENNTDTNSPDVIHIETNNFVKDMDKIFEDLDDYEGKTLTYEGVLVKTEELNNQYAVVRNYDMNHGEHVHSIYVGLEINSDEELPEVNSWVNVTGTIKRANSGGEDYPVLQIETITVMPEVGELKVTN